MIDHVLGHLGEYGLALVLLHLLTHEVPVLALALVALWKRGTLRGLGERISRFAFRRSHEIEDRVRARGPAGVVRTERPRRLGTKGLA